MPQIKALVTGFEPFGGEPINPALEALRRLPPRLGALSLATGVLPAVFGQAFEALEAELVANAPDIVLCVGLARGAVLGTGCDQHRRRAHSGQ